MAWQAAWAVELDAVVEHEDAYLVATDAVIAVGHGVDDGLAHSLDGILPPLLPLQAHQANPTLHVTHQESLGAADLVGQSSPHFG